MSARNGRSAMMQAAGRGIRGGPERRHGFRTASAATPEQLADERRLLAPETAKLRRRLADQYTAAVRRVAGHHKLDPAHVRAVAKRVQLERRGGNPHAGMVGDAPVWAKPLADMLDDHASRFPR